MTSSIRWEGLNWRDLCSFHFLLSPCWRGCLVIYDTLAIDCTNILIFSGWLLNGEAHALATVGIRLKCLFPVLIAGAVGFNRRLSWKMCRRRRHKNVATPKGMSELWIEALIELILSLWPTSGSGSAAPGPAVNSYAPTAVYRLSQS